VFSHRQVHVRHVVQKVALREVCSELLFGKYHTTNAPCSFILLSLMPYFLAIDSTVK
jgi:hypothetical protein